MLITCKECELPVSDKAVACPHCGYPLKSNKMPGKRRLRLPNGFGRITKIVGGTGSQLRNPYRAMVTIGHNEQGKPIAKVLKPKGYFKTYNEAYQALMEYHKNPVKYGYRYKVNTLFEEWMNIHEKEIKPRSAELLRSKWKYCSALYDRYIDEIQTRDIAECIEKSNIMKRSKVIYPSRSTKMYLKTVWVRMFDYAIAQGLLTSNCAVHLSFANPLEDRTGVKHHISFTDEEMKVLWANLDLPGVDLILIQCYSGWRPQEMCQMLTKEVNVNNWTFTGGMKTQAGTGRTVPIHSCIRDLVKKHYDDAVAAGRDTVFYYERKLKQGTKRIPLNYDSLKNSTSNLKEVLQLNPDHRPHDGRKHFVTMAKENGVDEYAIKRLVGHTIGDLTEEAYTDRSIEWLRSEMEKIPGPTYS